MPTVSPKTVSMMPVRQGEDLTLSVRSDRIGRRKAGSIVKSQERFRSIQLLIDTM